jgi:ankyrin repeat protein
MNRNKRFTSIRRLKYIVIGIFSFFAFIGFSFAGDSSLFVEKAMQNKTTEIEQLIKDGAEVNSKDDDGNTGLHWAASYGFTEMAEILISNGDDVNLRNNDGNAPLHWAAGQGSTEIVKLLIANGADINAKGKSNWTPLRWADAMDKKEISEILRKAGAKP